MAIAALLFSANTQAFLPTPLLVTEGALSSELSDSTSPRDAEDAVRIETSTLSNNGNNTQNNTASGSDMATEQLLATWRRQAKTDNLAQHTIWRRLLYFYDDQSSILSKKKTESLVDDPRFFLSDNGQQDSAAELDATLVALAKEFTSQTTGNNQANIHIKTQANNNSVLCRFPARVAWLKEKLAIDDASLTNECPELDDWMATLAPEQLSIVFAEEYLDNPLSAFGHTLLRIDSKSSVADPNQISQAYALNYTVDGDPNDSFPIYATKSMIGSYDSAIEIDPYPQKLAKYLQDDERDTWTYQLNLTSSEVQQVMRHVWETKALKMPYYFTTDNCASEILRLIDVIRPQQNLLKQLAYVVVPSDVIQL
jgi:hypothetical protein